MKKKKKKTQTGTFKTPVDIVQKNEEAINYYNSNFPSLADIDQDKCFNLPVINDEFHRHIYGIPCIVRDNKKFRVIIDYDSECDRFLMRQVILFENYQ